MLPRRERPPARLTLRRASVRPGWMSLLLRVLLAFGLIAVSVMVYLRADTVLVGLLEGKTEVGYYTAAYTLLLGLQIVPYMVARALIPVFARSHAAADRDLAGEDVVTAVVSAGCLSTPLTVSFAT